MIAKFHCFPHKNLTRIDFWGGDLGPGDADDENRSPIRSVVDFDDESPTTALIRCSTRCLEAGDGFCHLNGPNRARIDFRGADLVWGWLMNVK